MKAVGKSPVGAAVASAARYDQGAGPVGRAAAALTERMRGPQTAAPVAALPPAVAAPTVPAWKPPVAPPEGAIAPDALLTEALAEMNAHKIGALMVTENGGLVGLIHIHDLLRAGVA